MAASLLGHMAIALVLALIVVVANASTVIEGVLVGVLVWIGFVVTLEPGEMISERIPSSSSRFGSAITWWA